MKDVSHNTITGRCYGHPGRFNFEALLELRSWTITVPTIFVCACVCFQLSIINFTVVCGYMTVYVKEPAVYFKRLLYIDMHTFKKSATQKIIQKCRFVKDKNLIKKCIIIEVNQRLHVRISNIFCVILLFQRLAVFS